MPLDARTAAAPACTVLDTDFGDGARFLAVWRQWRNMPGYGRMLHYVGLLPAGKPPQPQIVDLQTHELAQALSHTDGHAGFHRLLLDGGQVSLTLCLGEAHTSLAQQSLQADTVYLTARSPAAPALAAVAKCCKRGTQLQWVDRLGEPSVEAIQTLKSLGFRALAADAWVFDPAWQVQRSRQAPRAAWTQPQRCTVIGAGISGAAVARVLALRGWQVQVIDAQAGPAQGASGLPAGLVSPVRSADDGPVSQLTRSGCALTRQHAQALLQKGQDWEASGAWLRRPAATGAQDAPPAQWLPEALWLKPAALVHAWLARPGVTFTGNAGVHRLERQGEDWVCLDEAGQELSRSPMVVIASALDAARLLAPTGATNQRADAAWAADATPSASPHTPATATPDASPNPPPETTAALAHALAQLHPMYGGVSIGPCTGLADLPVQPVQGRGNFLPSVPLTQVLDQDLAPGLDSGASQSQAQRRFWLAGASFDPQSDTPASALHQANRARLAQHLPSLAAALAPQFDAAQVQLWRGQRCVSHDRLPLVGAVQAVPDASLWISAAMGARGLSLAALCAELLAASIHGEPLPVPARLAKLLDAQRLQRQRARKHLPQSTTASAADHSSAARPAYHAASMKSAMTNPKNTPMVLVAGSANLDFVVRAPHIPAPGETVLGGAFQTFAGGKGANQAVACARAGGVATHMLLALGDDAFAAPIEASLQSAGVTLHTLRPSGVATGSAFICVDDQAENAITVAPGANACLTAAHLPPLYGYSHLLMQLEIPMEAVTAYALAAQAAGVQVALNAAPARPLPPELLAAVDLLVVNEGELRSLAGLQGNIADCLAHLPCALVVVTLGARGCVAREGATFHMQTGFKVHAVDTTGAGDTFCGALVAALAQQTPMAQALRQASAAAALACTQMGAQNSVPTAQAVAAFLAQSPQLQHASDIEALRQYAGLP